MKSCHLIFEKPKLFKDYYLNGHSETMTHIPNFNSINIIIGANNSGKSRFMRLLMVHGKFKIIEVEKLKIYNELVERFNFRNRIRASRDEYRMDVLPTDSFIDKIYDKNYLKVRESSDYSIRTDFNDILKTYIEESNCKKYFIPTLRTGHSLYESSGHRLDEDIYYLTLNSYYSFHEDLDVFTGMNFYKEILNSRNSEKKIRNRFEEFEKFLSKNFFNGKPIDIVANFNKDDNKQGKSNSELILIHVGDEAETRKLYDLGDGIQAIIILIYKIFMAEVNSFIYIDEPELNLHPGMQRLFLEQISTNPDLLKKKLTYIISTHSNHFLDLTIEKENVSIYSFLSKDIDGEKKFFVKNVNGGDNDLLKHLGVNNSSVFMANCGIWVEGVSDRNYIKAFLKSYLIYLFKNKDDNYKSIKEDIDFAFFEYAGSNIEHYIFDDLDKEEEDLIVSDINALALNNKIFLLADSDNAVEGDFKWQRLKALEEINNENFNAKIIRELRETENLLINDIWKKVLIKFCNKKLLKKLEQEIEIKDKISQALANVNSEDYKKEYIGEFLNDLSKEIGQIDGINILNQIFEKKGTTYGTLIPKRELSEYVLDANIEWEIFAKSKEIVDLTIDVYNFIVNSKN